LIYSVLLEKIDLIDPLIEKGSKINFQDRLGRTAIMIAVERENIGIVKKLLKYNPDTEIADFSGKSVYDYLAFVRKREIKKLFE
jgi:ankyrin repeat protein